MHTSIHCTFLVSFILKILSYPTKYIDFHFRKFFTTYKSSSSMLPILDNERQFQVMRGTIIPTATRRQFHVSSQTARSQHVYQYDIEPIRPNHPPTDKNDQTKQKKFRLGIFLHYTHEARLKHLKTDIQDIYHSTFRNTPVQHLKISIGFRNRTKSKHELLHHKRPPDLLRRRTSENSE